MNRLVFDQWQNPFVKPEKPGFVGRKDFDLGIPDALFDQKIRDAALDLPADGRRFADACADLEIGGNAFQRFDRFPDGVEKVVHLPGKIPLFSKDGFPIPESGTLEREGAGPEGFFHAVFEKRFEIGIRRRENQAQFQRFQISVFQFFDQFFGLKKKIGFGSSLLPLEKRFEIPGDVFQSRLAGFEFLEMRKSPSHVTQKFVQCRPVGCGQDQCVGLPEGPRHDMDESLSVFENGDPESSQADQIAGQGVVADQKRCGQGFRTPDFGIQHDGRERSPGRRQHEARRQIRQTGNGNGCGDDDGCDQVVGNAVVLDIGINALDGEHVPEIEFPFGSRPGRLAEGWCQKSFHGSHPG